MITFLTALLGAALGILATVITGWAASAIARDSRRQVGLQTWRDDLYTLANLVNHAGEQGEWPGSVKHYWRPTLAPALLQDINHSGAGGRSLGPPGTWGQITAAQRAATFVLAWWAESDGRAAAFTPEEIDNLHAVFARLEMGRLALIQIDRRLSTGTPRRWAENFSIWEEIRTPFQ